MESTYKPTFDSMFPPLVAIRAEHTFLSTMEIKYSTENSPRDTSESLCFVP